MSAAEPSQEILDAVHTAYTRSCERAVAEAAKAYDRLRDLPRIVAVWPDQLTDFSINGHKTIVTRLEKEAIALARMGRNFPHHYDRNRHIAVLGAKRAEKAQLAQLENVSGLARIFGGQAA